MADRQELAYHQAKIEELRKVTMRLDKTMKAIIAVAVAIVIALTISAIINDDDKAGALIPNEHAPARSAGVAFNPSNCDKDEYPGADGWSSYHVVCDNGNSTWFVARSSDWYNL